MSFGDCITFWNQERNQMKEEEPEHMYVEGTSHTVEEMEQPYSDGRGRYMSYSR